MFNGTFFGSIGVALGAFLLILFLDWAINPAGDWGPLFVVVPVMAIGMFLLIRWVNRR